MNYHQSYVFLQDRSNSFIVGSTSSLFILQEYLINYHGGVSRRHSQILKTKEGLLLNSYPFFQRFMVQAWRHPLIFISIVRILFTHPEQFRSLFSLILRSSSSQNYSFVVLQIIPVHHSSILLSARDLFVLMYLNPLKYLHSFSNSS